MIKRFLPLCLIFLLMNCGVHRPIKGENELLNVVGLTSLSYRVQMQYNELDRRIEGIYLCSLVLEKNDADLLLQNINNNEIKNLSDEKYIFHTWKKSPVQDDYDLSLFNYSPAPNKVRQQLSQLKNTLSSAGIYYSHFQDKENPFSKVLYTFDTTTNEIMIYYTFF